MDDPRHCIGCNTPIINGDFCNKECEQKALAKVKQESLEKEIVKAAMLWYGHRQYHTALANETDEIYDACGKLDRHRKGV